jgi:hypothetical protein
MIAVALQLVGKAEGMWQGEQRNSTAVPIYRHEMRFCMLQTV